MILKYLDKENLVKAKILLRCDKCGLEFIRVKVFVFSMRERPHYSGNDYCKKCCYMICNNRPEYKSNMSKTIQKMIKDRPEWCVTNSLSKKGKINLGEKNGMKRLEVRKKVSNSHKKNFENPKNRERIAKQVSKSWAEGKYDHVAVGKSKWFTYKHSNNTEYKVQGTWELAFIRWLDQNNIDFDCHKGRLSYILNGENKNYYPDFYIYKWNTYVDVKANFFYQKQKFDAIKSCNPNINIKIFFKEDLKNLGVKI